MTEQAAVSVPDNMPELGTTRATAVLATAQAINDEHAMARSCAEDAVQHAIRCGELLAEKKAELPRGEFDGWVEKHCDFKRASAYVYIRAAKQSSRGLDVPSLAKLFPSGRPEPAYEREARPLPAPQVGTYNLVYADPPWRYEHSKTTSRRIENQYPTMELEDIRRLPVQSISAVDCLLFLWATSPKLAEAMTVIEAWGFTYRTCAVWDKEVIGMGYYFRQQHELLLVATRGNPSAPDESSRVSSVIRSRRSAHSSKPEEAYEILERMYPDAVRVELFARSERDGWSGWGNQLAA